jgi:hypothetical protein
MKCGSGCCSCSARNGIPGQKSGCEKFASASSNVASVELAGKNRARCIPKRLAACWERWVIKVRTGWRRPYSLRNGAAGSRRVARLAGIYVATATVARKNSVAYLHFSGLTIPAPSLIVSNRFASTAAKFSTRPFVQRTVRSACPAEPNPKCNRRSLTE